MVLRIIFSHSYCMYSEYKMCKCKKKCLRAYSNYFIFSPYITHGFNGNFSLFTRQVDVLQVLAKHVFEQTRKQNFREFQWETILLKYLFRDNYPLGFIDFPEDDSYSM